MDEFNDKESDCEMSRVLDDLGLQHLKEQFNSNKITPQHIRFLTTADFKELGVSLGERVQIQQFCETKQKTGITTRLDAFRVQRKIGIGAASIQPEIKKHKKIKSTLQARLGWRHRGKLIPHSLGGGVHVIPIRRSSSLLDLIIQVSAIFFPNGKSKYFNIELQDVTSKLALFNGEVLPEVINGRAFTYENFVATYLMSPVRLYLMTELRTTPCSRILAATCAIVSEASASVSEAHTASASANVSEACEELHVKCPICSILLPPNEVQRHAAICDILLEEPFKASCELKLCGPQRTLFQLGAGSISRTGSSHEAEDAEEVEAGANYPRNSTQYENAGNSQQSSVKCPICQELYPPDEIEHHSGACDFSLDEPNFHQLTSTPTIAFGINRHRHSQDRNVLKDVLIDLHSNVNCNEKKNLANVSRHDIYEGARRCFNKLNFKFTAKLDVNFSGEDGIDDGGCTREFFRLVLKCIQESSIFSGPAERRTLTYVHAAYANNNYLEAGGIIAYIIMHGGPHPTFMSDLTFGMISKKLRHIKTSDVDAELEEQLNEILQCDEKDFFTKTSKISDYISLSGTEILHRFDRRKELVSSVLDFLVVERNRSCVAQFCEGLEKIKLHTSMVMNADAFLPVFTSVGVRKLSSKDLIFRVDWSTKGSNRRREEERVYAYYLDYVEELEGSGNLEKLLIFATGADRKPYLGFHMEPTIEFSHDLPNDDFTREYPKSNTCGLILTLPTAAKCYLNFKLNFNHALEHELFLLA